MYSDQSFTMAMKKITCFFLVSFFIVSCNNRSAGPDVSGIKVNVELRRFDQHFFSIDTLNTATSLEELQREYPSLLPVFINNILGLQDTAVFTGIRRFIRQNKFILDSVNKVFKNDDFLKKEFEAEE